MQQRGSVRRFFAAAILLVSTTACSKVPPPPEADATPSAAAPAQPEKPAPAPLSEEDERLIAADPKTLSPEDRRKRAYALRRKIMQDPDSPAARTLTDLQQGLKDGTIEVPGRGHTLSLPGTTPEGGAPPAGYRPPADDAPAAEDSAAP